MEKKKENNKIKKNLLNILLFLCLIIITFCLILKDQNTEEILAAVGEAKKQYLICGMCAMVVFISCEAFNIKRILKGLGEETSFLKNVKYALIGFFFSAITPAATGGQPMEIYYMHKDGISVANGTLALLVQLMSLQIVNLSLGIISVFFNFEVVNNGLMALAIIGVFLNSCALVLLIISIFSKKLSKILINFCVKILKFFKKKNIDQLQEKLEYELTKYQENSDYIKKNKKIVFKSILSTLVQMCAYYMVPFFVYKAYGLNEYGIIRIMSLQALLYTTVSGIPSPGSVGVSEGGFLGIFRNIFSAEIISSAMILNRVVNFYLLVLTSSIIVIICTLKDKKDEKTMEIAENSESSIEETIKTTKTYERKQEINIENTRKINEE